MNLHLKNFASVWAQRAQSELGAENRFRQLTEKLADLGAQDTVVTLARRAQGDERRHAIMCAQVARKYGHSTGFERFSTSSTDLQKSWEQRKSPEERLLCEVTLMCCITETVNASLLNSIYGSSHTNTTRNVIYQILKDEVKHSQIGWAHLSFEESKRDCRFLENYLDEMLEFSVKDELFLPPPGDPKDTDSFDYGVMPVALRLDQFKETMIQVVFPGFEKFGLNTSKARKWLREKAEISTEVLI